MPAPIIKFNNSSLNELACGLRYRYRVIQGAVTPKSPELRAGTLFHDWMKDLDKDSHAMLLSMAPPDYAKVLAPLTITKLAILAGQLRDNPHINLRDKEASRRELYLEVDYTIDIKNSCAELEGEDFTAFLCGTLDHLEYDATDGCVIITDFKTTQRNLDAKFYREYQLKSQRLFYVILLREYCIRSPQTLDSLHAKATAAAAAGRIKFRYVFANYVTNKVDVQTPQFIHEKALDDFNASMMEKFYIAVHLHLHPDHATKDGIFSGHCKFCPFDTTCEKFNPVLEQDMIEKWPYGFAPYDPEHHAK